MAADISTELRSFLLEHVESYEQLHALLYLIRQREVPVSGGEVSSVLGMSEDDALEALEVLRNKGLLVTVESPQQRMFRVGRVLHLDGVLDELQRVHEQQPVELARLMTANAIERARTLAARHFADAFLLRRHLKDRG